MTGERLFIKSQGVTNQGTFPPLTLKHRRQDQGIFNAQVWKTRVGLEDWFEIAALTREADKSYQRYKSSSGMGLTKKGKFGMLPMP